MRGKPPITTTIESYRRKRQQIVPLILAVAAILLVIMGIIIITISLSGGGFNLFATKIPTPTLSPTLSETPLPSETPTITPTPTQTATATPSAPFFYIIQEDDTLIGIVEKFNLGENGLLLIYILNPEIDPLNPIILIGNEILLPYPGMPMPTPTLWPTGARSIKYFVLPGDSLGAIAVKFNSTIAAIVRSNRALLTDANAIIYPGMLLTVPINIVTPIPTSTATATPSPTPTVTP